MRQFILPALLFSILLNACGAAAETAEPEAASSETADSSPEATIGSETEAATVSHNPACPANFFMDVVADPSNSGLPDPELGAYCVFGFVEVHSNSIPNHPTGDFPNSSNPNSVAAVVAEVRFVADPKLAAIPSTYSVETGFGISLNGIEIDPFAAEWWNGDPNSGWNYDPHSDAIDLGIDSSNAHVQPSGEYHYHGVPYGLLDALGNPEGMVLVGYAADGFPIYAVFGYNTAEDASSDLIELQPSYQVREGTRPGGPGGDYDGSFIEDYEFVAGLGELDGCNGRFGVTPEYPEGIYYYVLTVTFPYIPRCFVGEPEASFSKLPEGVNLDEALESADPTGDSTRQEALDACSQLSEGDACTVNRPNKTMAGSCKVTQEQLACVPKGGPPK